MSDKKQDSGFEWIRHLTGPVGALVICIAGIYYLGSWIDKMSDRHFEAIDQMVQDSKEDKEIIRKQQNQATKNQTELTISMKDLADQMEKIKECCKNKQ